MKNQEMTSAIRNLLHEEGCDIVGIADLSPCENLPDRELTKGIVYGIALDPLVIKDLREGPGMEYLAEYKKVNSKLDHMAEKLLDHLLSGGYSAFSIGSTTEKFDRESLSADFPHKTAAIRAGLGWIGKCDLLITKRFGSALRFNTVITNAPLICDDPVNYSLCSECQACVQACPVNAPSGREWKPGLHRDEFLDIRSCYLHCTSISSRNGLDGTICGICIQACPWTQGYIKRSEKEV